MDERMRARAPDDIDKVRADARFHVGVVHIKTAARDRVRIGERSYIDLIQPARVEARVPVGYHLLLVFGFGIAEQDLQQETIKLSFGQRVSSFVLDWIFGCQYREDRRELIALAVNRYLALLHRLEQRCLSFRGRAVDLIGQQYVSEDWTASQVEGGGRNIEDVSARDIRRHQVGRELDAVEAGIDDPRERLHRQCLRRAGHAFDQRVAFGEQGDENLFNGLFLTNDNFAEFATDVFDSRGDVFKHGVGTCLSRDRVG